MALKIYGTASEMANIQNLDDMLVNGIEGIVTFNDDNYYSLRYNDTTQKYECRFIPSDKFAEYSSYKEFSNAVFPMLTTFLS